MNAASRHKVQSASLTFQEELFGVPNALPDGFRYQNDMITAEEEEALARQTAVCRGGRRFASRFLHVSAPSKISAFAQ
jgi:hypothetical protein